MFSFLIFLIILSIMILVHEFGHFITARRIGIRVERFSLGFGPKLLAFKKDPTEYCICAIPLGGYVKLAGDSWDELKGERHEFLGRRPSERAKVIFAGPGANYILAFFCFWLVNIIGYPNLIAKVGEVKADSPAKASGVLEGDTIISVDGKPVKYWQELQELISTKKADRVELEILRKDAKIKLTVGLRPEVDKDMFGQKRKVNRIGIKSKGEAELTRHNLFEGFIFAGRNLFNSTAVTIKALLGIFMGRMSFRENAAGLIGLYVITSDMISIGLSAVLTLMSVVSINLAIINLLPVPVLDGGHLFFLGLERLRGRHLSLKVEEKISKVGFTLLMGLMVFILRTEWIKYDIWDKLLIFLRKFIK